MVLAVIVLTPELVTIPRICPTNVVVPLPAYALLRFAIVLLVMLAEVALELRIPATCPPVVEVEAVLALMLLAVAVLPMVLAEIVFVPEVT